ncbi:hypothetical protein [Polyangium fumosum]|uniref:Uncharacterized protein n=1 Tax=Polyangium fumosum TaxID=889272 RepID=A0A4U1J948_9BACT|nr:hypothetical protein [Polyangium fumosum]TKD03986.1 hypothetical protein E8A74_24355 [Polyangium fumosum]
MRLRARSVLAGAKRVLLLSGNIEAVHRIEVLLERESAAAEDAEGLEKRGGPQAALDLDAKATALRDAAKAKAEPRGTPVETETLDLLDGIIVSLARTAREAAEAAARELGEPAVATAFELSAL